MLHNICAIVFHDDSLGLRVWDWSLRNTEGHELVMCSMRIEDQSKERRELCFKLSNLAGFLLNLTNLQGYNGWVFRFFHRI